jgi:hypothetical protein
MNFVNPFLKNILCCCLTHLLKSDVCQVEFFIIRFMVSPHHKDNLKPLGSQSAQCLGVAMPLSPLLSVVELGPLAVVERDKGKPIHRVTQMFITGKTKLNHTTVATGLSHRHRSRLGLKVAKRFPATFDIAELSPDRGHQGSAFSARQRLSNLSRRARGEKTLDLVVVSLNGLNRRSQLIDDHYVNLQQC